MSPFTPSSRASLLIPDTGPTYDLGRSHLFIVLTDPCEQNDVLIVPVSSVRSRCDCTCLLKNDDHAFIKHDSFIDFRLAQRWPAATIGRKVDDGVITYKGKIDETLYRSICEGFFYSPFAIPAYQNYLKAFLDHQKN